MRKAKVIKFKNGATLIYKRNNAYNYTAVNLGYGSGYMANEKNGAAHFLEHMLFKQTTNRTEQEINEDRNKICFMNAATGPNSMFLTFSRSNRLIEESFEFASDLLLNTKLSTKYIEQEKGVITEERRIDNDKIAKDIYYQHSFIVTSMPRSKDISLGTFDDINSMSKQDLINYRSKYYNSKNFICCVVGKISLFKIKKFLNKYILNKLVINQDFLTTSFPYIVDKEPSMQLYKNSQEKTSILITYKIDDTYENTLLNYNYLAIGRYLNYNDKSMHMLMRKKGLIYSSEVNFAFSESNGQIYIKFDTNKDKILSCLKIINKCIRDILSGCITKEDISLFKKNYYYNKDETINISYENECLNIATDYAIRKKYYNIKAKDKDKAVNNINEDTIIKTAKEIFIGKKPYVTVMGNLQESEIPTYQEILKIFNF